MKSSDTIFFTICLHSSTTKNALTDPQLVRTPDVIEYWEPLAKDMDVTVGIEAEYHHKNKQVCWVMNTTLLATGFPTTI